MTDQEIIAVIQAHIDGKSIRKCLHDSELWVDVSNPLWDFVNGDYRVKPEPPTLPTFDEVELAIRANNMGGTEDKACQLCQCDPDVGCSPCPHCAVDVVLVRLLRYLEPDRAEKLRPHK